LEHFLLARPHSLWRGRRAPTLVASETSESYSDRFLANAAIASGGTWPRVRKLASDGKEAEHRLASYAAMRAPGNNAAAVVTALQAGMSTRSQEWASEGVMSKSAASRHWIEATAAKITELRERDLRKMVFFGLMLDGVCLGDGAVVVIALGLRANGEKVLLDFEVGASENAVVCTALVARLQRRGFAPPAGTACWPSSMARRPCRRRC